MSQDVYTRLQERSRRGGAAVYLRRPCDAASLERFQRRLESALGERAQWYLGLLRLTDGLQIDNSYFESAHDFIETNLEHRAMDPIFSRYLVFGHNGNVDMYVFDKEQAAQSFCVVGFYRVGDVYEKYSTIEDLLVRLLNAESA